MKSRKSTKRNIIQLAVIGVLTVICCGLGVVALTTTKTMDFGLGVKYTPEVLVEVQMWVDKDNDSIKDAGEFVSIFNSVNQGGVDYSASYIDNISTDTIYLKQSTANSTITLKILNRDTTNFLRCYINEKQTPTYLEPATNATAPTISDEIEVALNGNEQILGMILVSLKFEATEAVTITYISDGTTYQTQITESGTTIIPPEPTKENHVFNGWYIDAACTTPFDSSKIVTTSQTLYAKWMSGYKIEYSLSGCSVTQGETFVYLNTSTTIVLTSTNIDHTKWAITANGATITPTLDWTAEYMTATFTLTPTASTTISATAEIDYWDGSTSTPFPNLNETGAGTTEENAYIIRNGAHIKYLSDNVAQSDDKWYKMLNNVYLNTGNVIDSNYDLVTGRTYNSWPPIGGSINNLFEGVFDGEDYYVSGIYIDSTQSYQGLFGYVDSGAIIQHLNISNSFVKGTSNVGGVIGLTTGVCRIDSCSFSGGVEGEENIGGIAGYHGSSDILSCINYGKIQGVDSVGGISGYGAAAGIYNSLNIGKVVGVNGVGGIGGRMYKIYNCINVGEVTGESIIGSIAGNFADRIKNSYFLEGTAAEGVGGSSNYSGTINGQTNRFNSSGVVTLSANVTINGIVFSNGAKVWDMLNAWVAANGSQYKSWTTTYPPTLIY